MKKKKEAKVLFADVMIACTENQRISKNELLEIIRKFNKVAKSTSIWKVSSIPISNN